MRDKRQYQRAEFSVPVHLSAKDGSDWTAESIDISVGGLFVAGFSAAPIGTEVSLKFELPPLGEVRLPAFVRWTSARGFGLQFGLLGAKETHAIGKLVRGGSMSEAAS